MFFVVLCCCGVCRVVCVFGVCGVCGLCVECVQDFRGCVQDLAAHPDPPSAGPLLSRTPGYDEVEVASSLPDHPNVWTDGSLVLDRVTGISASGAGFFAHSSEVLEWESVGSCRSCSS